MSKLEDLIQKTLGGLLDQMGVEYEKITVEEADKNTYKVNLSSETSSALLIGWHGETMNALQYILKVLLWQKAEDGLSEDFLLTLDIDNYRERQEENIKDMAKRKADEALETKKSITLPPMAAYFRRHVHLYISELDNPNLSSESIGSGDERRVKIVYSK